MKLSGFFAFTKFNVFTSAFANKKPDFIWQLSVLFMSK